MGKKCYYLRHKIDQGRFAYLEIDQSWEDTFYMEFCFTDSYPPVLKLGEEPENRCLIEEIRKNALLSRNNALSDENYDWYVIESDVRLELMVKDFIESISKSKTE